MWGSPLQSLPESLGKLFGKQKEAIKNYVENYKLKWNDEEDLLKINYPWDIFLLNGKAIELDFQRITKGRTSAELPGTNQIKGSQLFVEKGGTLEEMPV